MATVVCCYGVCGMQWGPLKFCLEVLTIEFEWIGIEHYKETMHIKMAAALTIPLHRFKWERPLFY